MALTAANVLAEVRAILNESVAAFWSDAEINAWVTQAAQNISMTGVVETSGSVTLAASTLEYAVPTTFANPTVTTGQLIKVAAAHHGASAALERGLQHVHIRSIGNINADSTDDTPTSWALHGTQVFFAPVGTGASGTVTLFCHVETDDIADIPDIWQPLAILYGAAKGKQKDRRFAEANSMLAEYTNALAFLRNDILERGVDSRQMMTVPTRIVT